jgi:hypothetical protein
MTKQKQSLKESNSHFMNKIVLKQNNGVFDQKKSISLLGDAS